jgi:hypothetical protein
MDLFEEWWRIVTLHSSIYRAIDPDNRVALDALSDLVGIAAMSAAAAWVPPADGHSAPLPIHTWGRFGMDSGGTCSHGFFPWSWGEDGHVCAETAPRTVG